MKRIFVFFALVLLGLTACGQPAAADPPAISTEPGVVTVFKPPT